MPLVSPRLKASKGAGYANGYDLSGYGALPAQEFLGGRYQRPPPVIRILLRTAARDVNYRGRLELVVDYPAMEGDYSSLEPGSAVVKGQDIAVIL